MGFLGVDLDLAAGFDAAGTVDEGGCVACDLAAGFDAAGTVDECAAVAAVAAVDATCRAEVQVTWFSEA